MRWRMTIGCVSLVVLLLGLHAAARNQQNPYRLKEADQKKACLACHADFGEKLKKAFVHTPVRSGECTECHDPHVSSHGKLLSGDAGRLCFGCHGGVIPAAARSTHKVVADGECQKCHDPHAADTKAILVAGGDALCFGCHKELGEAISQARFKHNPVGQGCLTCHSPHG